MLLVGGYSGIGKTSLISELCRPIVRERGYFIGGKFDQVVRERPVRRAGAGFSEPCLASARRERRPPRGVARRPDGLRSGRMAALLAEVIPEIEFVIGKQARARRLSSPPRRRTGFATCSGPSSATLARTEHPLVIFLDDLQWVDAATLELLLSILTDSDPRALLVIGAYRDNEVGADHPLSIASDRLERGGARIRRLFLGSLDQSSLLQFLADCLRVNQADVMGSARA